MKAIAPDDPHDNGSTVAEPQWGDPHPWPELDKAALYGPAGDVVRTLDPHTEADPAAVLLDFLVTFGNVVGPRPHARVGGAKHPARLFGCIVGDTSRSRKGQSHSDVQPIFEQAAPEWFNESQCSGLATGEGLIKKLNDDTSTALVYEPEFARVLAAAGRRGATLSEILRQTWDTGDLQVLTRKAPLHATGTHVSMIAHITLDELRASLPRRDMANGFANRFLYVCARRSKKLPAGGQLDAAEIERLAEAVRGAIKKADTIGELHRSAKAEALWKTIYCELLPDPGGLLGDVTARAEAQLLRLSLVYALLDGSPIIQVAHLIAAWAVHPCLRGRRGTMQAQARGWTLSIWAMSVQSSIAWAPQGKAPMLASKRGCALHFSRQQPNDNGRYVWTRSRQSILHTKNRSNDFYCPCHMCSG